jgi:hypothetical protein
MLRSRASLAASGAEGRMLTPGAVIERIEVLVPILAANAWSASRVQGGMVQPEGSPPAASRTKVLLVSVKEW